MHDTIKKFTALAVFITQLEDADGSTAIELVKKLQCGAIQLPDCDEIIAAGVLLDTREAFERGGEG